MEFNSYKLLKRNTLVAFLVAFLTIKIKLRVIYIHFSYMQLFDYLGINDIYNILEYTENKILKH